MARPSISLFFLVVVCCTNLISALPSSIVDEIKNGQLRETKTKRSQPIIKPSAEENSNVPYFSKPTAIKRGGSAGSLKNPLPGQESFRDWEQEREQLFENPTFQSGLFSGKPIDEDGDGKSIAEYEKGFQYGINKEKLDEALENAVLKSELYGDDDGAEREAVNQYRYFGNNEQSNRRRRRRRRDVKKVSSKLLAPRLKRDADLTPEEILTLLSLYEQNNNNNNRHRQTYDNNVPSWYPAALFAGNNEQEDEEDKNSDDEWLSSPVLPHANNNNNYYYDNSFPEKSNKEARVFDEGTWGGFQPEDSASRKKRFMVAKKRDPTHELRFLNGPNRNNFNTLTQLLASNRAREPNVPLYHRLVL